MKLSDLFEADVVDFATKKKEREFLNKVGNMSKSNSDDASGVAADIDAADARDRAMAMEVQRKYGRDVRAMQKFLSRPIVSGGFKSAYALAEALDTWRRNRKGSPERVRRAVQLAAADDNLFHEIQQKAALWQAITNHYPVEVIWALPNNVIDDFEVLEDLFVHLGAARHHFHGK